MNRIFKVVWSKAKNCYVVASELAKGKTKSPKSNFLNKTLIVGVLTCLLNIICHYSVFAHAVSTPARINGATFNSDYTFSNIAPIDYYDDGPSIYNYTGIAINNSTGDIGIAYWSGYSAGGGPQDSSGNVDFYKVGNIGNSGSATYLAGNGISISSDNKVSVKAGTGITVNSSGVSITAGSVASGNANAITGGTAYSELRPSANGNYVNLNLQNTSKMLLLLHLM